MTRHQSRQEAFCLLFEKSFSDMTLEEIIEGATETRDLQPNEFTMQLAQGTVDHVEELDALIEPKLKNWKLSRISKGVAGNFAHGDIRADVCAAGPDQCNRGRGGGACQAVWRRG